MGSSGGILLGELPNWWRDMPLQSLKTMRGIGAGMRLTHPDAISTQVVCTPMTFSSSRSAFIAGTAELFVSSNGYRYSPHRDHERHTV